MNTRADLSLIEINLEDLHRQLSAKAIDLSNKFLSKIIQQNMDYQLAICQRFEAIEARALKDPEGFQEMAELLEFMEHVQTVELPSLKEELAQAHKRLLYTIKFGALNEESIKLNNITFSWPGQIGPILEKHGIMMEGSKGRLADNLRERRLKFEQELDEIRLQVEEFKDVSDFDETPFYYKKCQNLAKQLQAYADTVAAFNKEEQLLGWPQTTYPIRKQIMMNLEPFQILYGSAVNFQRSYKKWMDGSIIELEAEQIEADLDSLKREVYKIMAMIADMEAPLQIIKHVKEKIEEFTYNLPIIRVLCNPGLRDRHWERMSEIVGVDMKPDATSSFRKMLKMNLDANLLTLQEVSGIM
jgi:dynein heavy chain